MLEFISGDTVSGLACNDSVVLQVCSQISVENDVIC